jgi:thiol-disulfide isomerase/thioredoxin
MVSLTGGLVLPAFGQQFEKKVTLETRSHTWRDAKPFDIVKNLTAKLRSARIQVVPRGAREKDADILIEYNESKGGDYITPFNSFGDKFGTRIRLTLTVLSAASGDTLLTLWAEGSTPFSVSGKTLYEAALEEFRSDNNYRYAEHFVGGTLGMKSSLSKLVPAALWPNTRQQVLSLLNGKGYRPANAREEAFLAIAREDYDACVSIGKPAVEPVIQIFNTYVDEKQIQKAARALGKIGDPRAATPLLEQLRNFRNVADFRSPEQQAAVIAMLEAIGQVGDNFALPDLNEFARHKNGEVAAAARTSAAKIRERLTGKKQLVQKVGTAPVATQTSQSTPPATIAEIGGVLAIGANAPDFVFFSPRTHQIISLRDDPAARRLFAKNNPSLPPPLGERSFFGGPVLVYFWGPATLAAPGGITKPYCAACPKIMDLMQSLHDSFALDGLQIVGFAQNVPDADLKDAAQHYSHLVASYLPDLAKALGCTALPSWALLDTKGKLLARSDSVFERDYIAGKVREVLKQGQSAGAQTPPPILSTAAKTASGAPLAVEPDQSQGITTAGEKVGADINKRGQPAKVGQASPATVDKALGGKKEPAEATGDAPGGQEKERDEDWRDMKKNFGVLTMVGKDKLGTDVKKWNEAIKNGYFRAVVEAVLNRSVARGEFSKGQERILGQGMIEECVLEHGDNLYLAQRIVVPGPPGKGPRIDTYEFLLLGESTTIESAVEKIIETIRRNSIILTRAEQAAAAQIPP